jgi:hypothetical protein
MRRPFRLRPRHQWAAWLLVALCWLSPVTMAAGGPPAQRGSRPASQYLVRRAEITLSVPDAERTATALEELARTVRGHFDDNRITIFVSGEQREVRATLLLPPEMLDTALARLRGIGLAVLSEELENRDVSSQVTELNRRLAEWRARRRQLRNLLDRAATDSERRAVETALAQVEAEMADAEATLDALLQETDWAVIHVLAQEAPPTATPAPTPTVTAVPVTPSPTPWRPGETVEQATRTLMNVVQGLTEMLIVVVILGGPFLVLALVGWWIRARVWG